MEKLARAYKKALEKLAMTKTNTKEKKR